MTNSGKMSDNFQDLVENYRKALEKYHASIVVGDKLDSTEKGTKANKIFMEILNEYDKLVETVGEYKKLEQEREK